jgi:hypothetical protein
MSKVKTWADFNKFSFSNIAINESDPAQVLSDEDAKAAEEIKKQLGKDGIELSDGIILTDVTLNGATLDFSSDGVEVVKKNDVEAATKEDPNKTPSYSSGGYTVSSPPPGLSGAHSSDSDAKLRNLGDTIANAAEYAGRGLKNTDRSDSPVFGSALSPDGRKQIKDYFFGPEGAPIPTTTVGSSELGLSAFSGSSLNGGIDASNQGTFQSKKTEVLKTENTDLSKSTSNLAQPKYYNIGKPSFVGSKEYKDILDSIGKNRKSALRFLEDIGVDTELIRERENHLVALRSPLDIKNSYPNDFTDFFILFKIDGDIDTFLGSTTPSPAFRVKDWYDYFIKIGFTKLIVQQGSYILDPGVYKFVIKDTDTKSKYFGSAILQQDGTSNFHKYGLGGSAAEAKRTNTFSPGDAEKGRIDLCITPALPGGRNADGLDATTSGDQVIKNATAFDKILAAAKSNPSATLPYILAENNGVKSKREERRERREERKEEKKDTQKAEGNEEAGKVNESFSQNGMKYLKKFGR